MTSLSKAHQKALEARRKMLDVRPKDRMPPLPDSIVPDRTNCLQYFQIAGDIYFMAAEAYSAGDVITGHTYELWAYQYIMLGQACERETT